MPDLTLTSAATCATNQGWSTKVKGSQGGFYTVSWCYQRGGSVQYDYECTCRGFAMSGHRRCKHIKQVVDEHLRCGWNEALEPTLKAKGDKCPDCGGPVAYLRVGV